MERPADNGEEPRANVEVQDNALEHEEDSAYSEGDVESYTTSLRSSVENYKIEHGRRYHSFKEGRYLFPNDEQEQERYDLMHHILVRSIGDKLFLAPASTEGTRILDLGTGSGGWAVDVADMYPAAEVVGNDLSPIQPRWVPPNLTFEVDDFESEWSFDRPFDFIHARYICGSVADWPKLMRQAYDNLKPGGYVEFQDYDMRNFTQDDSLSENNQVAHLFDLLIEAADKMGRTANPGIHLREWVEQAGFENVRDEVFLIPLGAWPRDARMKEIGTINMVQFLDGLEGFTMAMFTKILGWSVEEIQVLLAGVRKDAMRKDVHMLHRL
ncbi:uncharacterized protein HMPREF1541_04304 [Cyphellophora europaea CBS 101466]|uniref:Methyltransferase domain-containing protein n=1 Tax=Cyphellophora europaea (strain CBS 101466) TaxID=1220924 RepID=W2RWG7_CYPE1|nr:uncharacterized protein HMPREF1541_04304 [Cyphellophora europaea CBS 101466]ETN40029.1 hypothetical protein HMPREF1541_04304 [Cyphellophora europaea CBS 101466]